MVDPVISVIIPTYGRPQYLAEALASVKAQSYTRWEAIVVDDSSPEPVQVPEWATLVRHRKNLGLPSARNTGLAHATGELITFLDDDDWFHPDRFRWAVDEIGDARIHACASVPGGRRFEGDMRISLIDGLFPAVGQCVHRAEDIVQFDPTYRTLEDKEWWLRMLPSAVFAYHDEPGVTIRQHGGTRLSAGDPATKFAARAATLRRHRQILARDRTVLADYEAGAAGAALAAGNRRAALGWAMRSLASKPSLLAAKIGGRALRC